MNYTKLLTFLALVTFFICQSSTSSAQIRDYQEYGVWLGGANYFGDINPSYDFGTTRPAGGFFYKYTTGAYIALKGGVNYARLTGRDNRSSAPFQSARNLDFKTNVVEATAQVEFNFKKYIPGNKKHFFTPYLTLGISVFHFNPKTTFEGTTYNLQELGTEGQQNPYANDVTGDETLTPYKLNQLAIPLGFGYKHWISDLWNLGFEVSYRFAMTDYLDDVSTNFVSTNVLGGSASIPAAIADRSDEVGESIAENGRQRGDRVSNDGFAFIGIFVTYTIFQGNCPKK